MGNKVLHCLNGRESDIVTGCGNSGLGNRDGQSHCLRDNRKPEVRTITIDTFNQNFSENKYMQIQRFDKENRCTHGTSECR